MRLSGVDTNVPRDTLQCPMCTFSTSNRLEFTNHLISCCTLKRDNDAAPRAVLARFPNRATERSSNEDDYSPTLRERAEREIDRSTIGLGDFSVDWQGDVKKQVKSFREGKCCKQCNYVANTKMEYWEHMRCHIKGFTCPKCSFVTKYKHHMNHHWLSVHDGSKPFKCKKCSYTCVSKSMLTSHLKKHSNVYPYRCANCTYKTKFCNALKKHLRKKGHEPAVVLNADGSPNPLSIIDVYGTKRGPKQRPSDKKRDESDQNEDVTTTNDDQSGSAGPISPVSPLESPVAAHSLATSTTNGTTNDTAGGSQSAMNQNRSIVTFPYSDLVAAFNLSNLLFREDVRGTAADYAQRSDVLLEYTKKMNYNLGNLVVPGSFVQNLAMTCFDGTDDNDNDKSETYANGNANDTIEGSSAFVTSRLPPIEAREDKSTNAPLDLRKTDVIRKNQFHLELSITDLPERTISSNRRKGKAVKLDRRLVEKYEEPANDAEFFESTTVGTKERKNCSYDKIEDDRRTIASLTDNRLICYYCEIAFGDAAMYSVHMGYHGFNDPYTCNMCGHQCTDRLSFFLHIGRSKHT
ncbi:Protein hunchback [Ooceraea biroi]|nr:Protein hunchback [Ooceraea biroi]